MRLIYRYNLKTNLQLKLIPASCPQNNQIHFKNLATFETGEIHHFVLPGVCPNIGRVEAHTKNCRIF